MCRLAGVIIIIFITLNYSVCDSSIETINIDDGKNNVPLNILELDNRNIKNKTLAFTKFANEETSINNNSQPSLIRNSRTISHKPLYKSHSKRKQGCSNKFKHDCKGHKFDLLIEFFKQSSYILKGFMGEIEEVLNWWSVALKNLKNKLKQKNIEVITNGRIELMDEKLPKIRNKVFELMGFLYEFFNFNKNSNNQNPFNKISADITGSLKNIKNFANLFIMLLQESQLMENNSNNKLAKINNYFDSIPAEQCSILDYGLVNGYKDMNIDGIVNKNSGYNNEIDILKGQTYMLQIMWNYISQLPAIFTSIFELIGELFIGMDSMSTSSGLNNEQNNSPLPLPPWQSLLNCHSQSNNERLPYLSGQFGIDKSISGNIFSSGGHLSPLSPSLPRPSPISEPYFIKKHINDLTSQSLTNLGGYAGINAQLDYSLSPLGGNMFNHGYTQDKPSRPVLPTHHWLNLQVPVLKSNVLLLFGVSELVIGDIIILNLTENIILVGQVDGNSNYIIFNIIHRAVSLKSSYGQNHVWNLSYRDLSHNSRIYNEIMSRLGCN